MPAREPVGIRIARRLRQDGECIIWTGAVRPSGYGVVGGREGGHNWYDSPHRKVYELTRGAIPSGRHLDHLCRNRACVNPNHLEPVTQAENNRRANALRWHKKRHGKAAPGDQWITMTLADLVALLTGERPTDSDSTGR